MTEKFVFLSPEWDVAAEELAGTTKTEAPAGVEFSLNATVSPTPYGDKPISIVVGDGIATLDKVHIDNADITVMTDYETAYRLFLEGDMNVILSAMLEGRITVRGDIAKLLALSQSSGPMPSMPFLESLGAQLRDITAEL